ncbi:MAG: HAMP domain-containing sensor histidine kinase [Ignavibacteriaceae bacterium]|nr:HAMP domain-containing sensor histidine kinase [Ignavibacteriaceae bacterium]
MKMSGGPPSVNFKVALFVIALLIASATLFYTQNLVTKLQKAERQIVELYGRGIEYVANNSTPDNDISFLFDNIIKPINFPLILTDAKNHINLESKSDIRNIDIDTTLSKADLTKLLTQKLTDMDNINPPINVTYQDTIVLQKIHYGDSAIINTLKFYPYLQILFATLFILIGYMGFSNIKKNEQSNIWAGMAKETAHQFGTPISSLMGWLEMLKGNYSNPDKVLDIADEIENDVEKLSKVTHRFSKIGSIPELKPRIVYEEVKKVTEYFQRRLPQTGKVVDLNVDGDKEASALLNSELFGWVIENLIKNALDAIDHKKGQIQINVKDFRSRIEIDVSDNGKGIEIKRRKDVFRPGYSTKRRGWGLGLSLSKRIIEGYHKGKIFVKNSAPGEGTTFKIILKKG